MILRYIFLTLLFNVSSLSAQEQDFDAVCRHFETLESKLSGEMLSGSQRLHFINKLVDDSLPENSPARQAWHTIIYAVPSERYEMYSYTAKEILNTDWHCEPMKKLIVSVGEQATSTQ